MRVVVWCYCVAADRCKAFETAYGLDGPWIELFSESPDYADTDLLRGEYARVEEATADLADEEVHMGRFDIA